MLLRIAQNRFVGNMLAGISESNTTDRKLTKGQFGTSIMFLNLPEANTLSGRLMTIFVNQHFLPAALMYWIRTRVFYGAIQKVEKLMQAVKRF